MKRVFLSFFVFALAFTAGLNNACAGNEPEAYGEVIEADAASGALTIMEYDYKDDKDIKKTYNITDKTKLVNIKALSGLKKGDWVGIYYKTEQGAPAALTVLLDVPFEIPKEEEDDFEADKEVLDIGTDINFE